MKIVERFEIEITTDLNESLAELRKITNKNYFSFFGFNEKTMFRGKISKTYFKITKIANARGILEAVSTGNMFERDGKIIIEVSVRPAIYSIVSSMIAVIFLLFIIVFFNLSVGSFDVTMNIVFLFFALVFTMIPLFAYDEEKEKSKKKLIEIFK